MLIDPLSIHYSNLVASTVIDGPDQKTFIDAFQKLLLSVGWTVAQDLFTTGSVSFPLGVPTTAGVPLLVKLTVGCAGFPGFLSIGDWSFTLYDPFTEVVGTTFGCTMVPMDTTPFGTLLNLASFISAGTPFNATATTVGGVLVIQLVAKAGGPDYNLLEIRGAGGFVPSGGNSTGGGGWQLQSRPESSVYLVGISASTGHGVVGNLVFDFLLNGGPVQYRLLDSLGVPLAGGPGVGAYTVIANGYGFAVMEGPQDTGGPFRTISLFAMAPYYPTTEVPASELFTAPYSVMTVGPNSLGGPPSWSGNSAACLDGAPFTSYGNNPWPRLLALRSPGPALLTPAQAPLVIGAYVMFGKDRAEAADAWVIGKLWDCALMSDVIETGATIDGRHFLTLGYSDGSSLMTRSTLLMAAGKTVTPDPTKPPPPQPPPPKSGTVNLFGDGVTWLSGDKFSSDMEGGPITIKGDSYLVLTFIDDEHLTLTSAKTIASNAPYTVP